MGSSEGGVGTGGNSGGSWTNVPSGGDIGDIIAYLNHWSFGTDGDYTGNGGYGGDNTGPMGSKEAEKDAAQAAALLDAITAVPGQALWPSSRRAGERDLWRKIESYTGVQAPMGSLGAFVGQDVDPYSGEALGNEGLDPFTGMRVTDPFTEARPRGQAGRASSYAAIGRRSLLSSPDLLAANGPMEGSNATVRADSTWTQEICHEEANRWSLVCLPTSPVPGRPPEPPIEEVTVRGVRPIRQPKPSPQPLAPAQKPSSLPTTPEQKPSPPPPAPDWTTQVEWAYPKPDSRLIQPLTHFDTGNRPLNFVLNKIILPWRNALAFYENVVLGTFIGIDDALEHSPFQQEYHAAQVMMPMSRVMSIGVAAEELMLGMKYAEGLLSQVSGKNILTSLTFMSMGVEGGGGSLPWLRSGAVAPGRAAAQSRLINPRAGEELYVGEWLNSNLQVKLDETVRSFVADPHTMAALVPPNIPYRAVPQYGGFVIEYGQKAAVEGDWILNNIVRGVPQSSQMVKGGAPDLVLRLPFAGWNLRGWDITTARSAAAKAARGVDYTFLPYTIDWKALGL
jgi:hypothetical protein